MEKDANYFTVGVFVSLTLIALVGFTIWLAGLNDLGPQQRYTIYFTDPVSGLTDEADVKYKGVDVGKITALRLDPTRTDLIKVDIEVKEDTPVRSGTTARIAMQGVTGQSYIELSTDMTDKAPPQRVAEEQYPVLKGTGSKIDKFLDGLPGITQQLRTTLTAIDDLSREGSKTAGSVRELADTLKEDPSQLLNSPSHKGVEIPK